MNADKKADTLAQLFHEKSMFVHMGGSWGKQQELDVIKGGGIWYKQAEVYSVTVNVIDNTVILLNDIDLVAVVGGNEVINPFMVTEVYINENGKKATKKYVVDTDEGPRADTSPEALAKLKPVFAAGGSVTAGNSSQTSDGAAFVVVMSERMVKELGIQPIGRLVACASAGVHPRIMGIGPVAAIPKVLKQAGMNLGQIDLVELNEAFASQSIAVIREAGLNPEAVNPNGGAIALGHPLGCTGAKLTIQALSDLKRTGKKYGMVTACVGGGQGIAGILERL